MKIIHVIYFSAILFFTVSCAKKESEGYNETEQRSFEKWMELNVDLTDPDIEQLDNGMYLHWLHRSGNTQKPEGDHWLKYNYTGYTLAGHNVFTTRYEEIARLEGTFTWYTHYDPELIPWTTTNGLTPAERAALSRMTEGDSVRIYAPSRLAYGSGTNTFYYGYQGHATLDNNTSVIIDMKLEELITMGMNAYEETIVKNYAVNEWNFQPGNTDYLSVSDSLYFQLTAIGDTTTVPVDSLVNIYYKAYFPDGFIFSTNIDSVGQRIYHNSLLSYLPRYYTPSSNASSNNTLPTAFYRAFKNGWMKYDSWGRMIFRSDFGYGESGYYPSTSSTIETVVQPYQPLIYEFYIMPEKDEED